MSAEEATAHDAVCAKHPAVLRAEQAEAERYVLAKWISRLHPCSPGALPEYWIEWAQDVVQKRKEADNA